MKVTLEHIKLWISTHLFKKGRKRYVTATFLFIVWMLFFDQYRVSKRMELSNTIENLEQSKKYYENETKKALVEQRNLEKNKEKYAREKYLMHKENEEVFVLQNK